MKRITDRGALTANHGLDSTTSDAPAPTPLPRNAAASGNRQAAIGKPRSVSSRSIEVHIDELVLHGFSQADRRPIADAIERELSALLACDGLPVARSFEIEHLNGGTFRVGETARPESAGASVARAIYGGLGR